jgi:hypothetical protein
VATSASQAAMSEAAGGQAPGSSGMIGHWSARTSSYLNSKSGAVSGELRTMSGRPAYPVTAPASTRSLTRKVTVTAVSAFCGRQVGSAPAGWVGLGVTATAPPGWRSGSGGRSAVTSSSKVPPGQTPLGKPVTSTRSPTRTADLGS